MPHVLERRLAAAFHELDEIREQRRERLHLQRIADELDRVAANRDPRGDASCTTWRISSAGPTMSAMFTLRGAVRVIWVWSVMGALYHARPARASMSSNRQGNIVQVIKICRERRGGSSRAAPASHLRSENTPQRVERV